jgi:hypothetical protein
MAKTNMSLNSSVVKRINEIKTLVSKSNPFSKVTTEDVLSVVFSKSAKEIIDFVSTGRSTPVSSTPAPVKRGTYKKRRRKFSTLPKEWRDSKIKELEKNGEVQVKNVKEASSIYNFFYLNKQGKGKVSYFKKRGGVMVKLTAAPKKTVKTGAKVASVKINIPAKAGV